MIYIAQTVDAYNKGQRTNFTLGYLASLVDKTPRRRESKVEYHAQVGSSMYHTTKSHADK